MKELDKFIIESNGVLPDKLKDGTKLTGIQAFKLTPKGEAYPFEQFQKRAKELGFVGKYRWGVKYKTDGKRPDLADDVEVDVKGLAQFWMCNTVSPVWWAHSSSFKITDSRYKPADTSYLDKAGGIEQLGVDDHFDMSELKDQFNRLPEPMKSALKQSFDDWFNSEVLSRKAKAEREKFAFEVLRIRHAKMLDFEELAGALYDAGFRLPD
jgi:hypothetical protein